MTEQQRTSGDVPEVLHSAGVPSSEVAPASVPDGVKAMLPVGAFMTSDHRYYFNGDGPFPSVTTILEVMSKPALVQWKAKETARAYIRNRAELDRILMDPLGGEDAAITRALQLADKSRDMAASVGTSVHLLADMVLRDPESDQKGFGVSDDTIPYLEGFKSFLSHYSGSQVISSEKIVLSENGYAGTYDLILRMADGELWLVDIKTGKSYYPEYGLQLAAYRWADHIILPGDPRAYAMPEVQRTAVLHLRPDLYKAGWSLIEYPTSYTKDFMTFLGALEVFKWRKEGRFSKSNLKNHRTTL